MINSSLHQNIIAAEGGWIVTLGLICTYFLDGKVVRENILLIYYNISGAHRGIF
jgi:hypothetical protein